ncbi:hypothetical protein Mag101_12020 [Microbulbifer agarilyticus]|uniref:Glycosyltransferase RgtA/B/C/D-like domain-containing protein n=1 Tax=Microbulbifer agarilyticus TaxID=260552 RepID=A0A1Q2M6X6_9GAMM|nr:hypothetical protein [Microbulbifer agarilyticus]AQQ68288.1 hypothetical protein Mag101_12020 [Microbulbifer agarilyticus]
MKFDFFKRDQGALLSRGGDLALIVLPQGTLHIDRRWLLYAGLYLLIALGIWLRIDHILTYNPIDFIWSDPQRHWEQGTETLRTDPMTLTDPVMYQLYIGMLAKLTLGEPLLIAFYTVLLACVTPWIWYRFARELLSSRLMATAVWAGISLLPSWIAIYGYFMQETLLLPLLGAALYASWRCRRKQTLASFLLMVVLWAAAGLTRGIAIPFAAVVTTWLWLVQPQKIAKAGYSLLVLGLIMGPLVYRSYSAMHLVAPHGIGKLNELYARSGKRDIHISYDRNGARWVYWFASPAMDAKPLAPLSDWSANREGVVKADIDITNGSEDWDAVMAEYPLTFARYLQLTGDNLVNLFFGSSWPDNNQARWLEAVNHHTRWVWAPITLLLMLAALLYWRRLGGTRLLSVLLFTWVLVQGLLPISVNEGRYRKPVEGLLLVQAVVLAGAMRRRRADDAAAADTVSPESVEQEGTVVVEPSLISQALEPVESKPQHHAPV